MTKTAKWKSQRHIARAEKRTAKARQRAQNARKQRGMYGASKTPQNTQIAPFTPFLQLLTRGSGAVVDQALAGKSKVTVFQSNRRAA